MPASLPSDASPVLLKVNVVRTEDGVQRRVVPELDISSADAPTVEQFYTELKKRYEELPQAPKVKTWQADGMSIIHDNVEWLSSQLAVGMHEWMDGQLKILVEV